MKVAHQKMNLGIISLILLMGVGCIFFACQKQESVEPQYKVLLLNSYHFDYAHSSNSVQLYRDCFAKKGVNVDLQHVFLEFPYGSADKQWEERIQPKLDSLADWTPDLVLLNNDFAVQVATLNPEWLRHFPVVYGGVIAPDDVLLDFFPNMTGFVCPPDYLANLRFIKKVTGQNQVVMELDYTYIDSLLRNQLSVAEKEIRSEGYQVITASVNSLYRDIINGDSVGAQGKRYWDEIYHQAKYNAHLQVVVDLCSNQIMNRSNLPQFTATDVSFANGDGRLVGGYFPALETQISDQVDYAVQILQGVDVKSLPRAQHQAAYFMDYDAMKLRDMDYDEWKNEATIVNVPFYVAHPVLLGVLLFVALLLVIFATWAVARFYVYLVHRHTNRVLQELHEQKERRNLLLASSQSANWVLLGGLVYVDEGFVERWNLPSGQISLVDFTNFVHRDDLDDFRDFLTKKNNNQNNQTTLRLTFDQGETWHWFDMNYKVLNRNGEEVLLGLLMNMDRQKIAEDQLQQAQQAAEVVEMKEMFLANMNHDIRTPLSAIAGFADVIADMGDELDDESMQAYSEIITQNSGVLLKLLDDVLNMRGGDLGKFRYYPKQVKVDELLEKAYRTNKVLCPQCLEFRMLKGKAGLTIFVDQERTMQVINNFLSNAFKFTNSGYVALGWQYTEMTNEVELFVIDTGIGIASEQQRNLFDRYYKTCEGHQGTGLGLHISKTLVEDQQGHIDVRSSLGVGSRFSAFFNVCRMLLLLLGFGFTLTACQQTPMQQHPDNRDFRVAVIHSYDAMLEDYNTFDQVLKTKFRKEGLSVQTSTFYLDLVDVNSEWPEVKQTLDSLERLNPDLIMMDDDLGVQSMLRCNHPIIRQTPVVVGGLELADWTQLYDYPLLTGFESPISYPRNIELGKELWDINLVEIELDHTPIDSLRRKKLAASIARPPFANNSDLHLRDLGWVDLKEGELKDSIVVMVISLRSPERNVEKVPDPNSPIEDPIAYTRNLQMYSYAYPQVIVKHDGYSNNMVDPYDKPQITAVRTNFGTKASLYIGGYFASTETVANDMADYAVQILKGTPVAQLPPAIHKSAYYIDYNALQRFEHDPEWHYRDFEKRGYVVVNLPNYLRYPYLYFGLSAFLVLLLIVLVVYLTRRASARRSREMKQLKQILSHEIELGDMVLDNFRGTLFSYRNGLLTMDERFMKRNKFDVVTINDEQFRSFIHPDHMTEFDQLMESFQIPGTYDHHIFIKYMEDQTYHWLLMHYVVNAPGEADGFSMMDDLAVMRELKIQTAQQQMKMVNEKNEFLNNISYIVRGPLNSVLGFSNLLSKDYSKYTLEERREFCQIIRKASQSLLDTVNKVLELSRIESGRAEMLMEPIDPKSTVDNVYTRWCGRINDKPNVKLRYHQGREGLMIMANAVRLESALDVLMKRALDNTDEGTVTIGWYYNLGTHKLVLYVEDTGEGMYVDDNEGLFRQSGDLDLALVHSIVTHMQGVVEVQSQMEVGTRFVISFDEITPPLKPYKMLNNK